MKERKYHAKNPATCCCKSTSIAELERQVEPHVRPRVTLALNSLSLFRLTLTHSYGTFSLFLCLVPLPLIVFSSALSPSLIISLRPPPFLFLSVVLLTKLCFLLPSSLSSAHLSVSIFLFISFSLALSIPFNLSLSIYLSVFLSSSAFPSSSPSPHSLPPFPFSLPLFFLA